MKNLNLITFLGENKLELSTKSPVPEIPAENIQDSPDYIRKSCRRVQIAPVELFSDRSPDLREIKWGWISTVEDHGPSEVMPEFRDGTLSINAGGTDNAVVCDGVDFQRDSFFTGGDDNSTNAEIGGGKTLYHSARIGNFFYKFQKLEPGEYLVDLHFAEIVFTDDSPGMRIFDVFIQEEKARVIQVNNVWIHCVPCFSSDSIFLAGCFSTRYILTGGLEPASSNIRSSGFSCRGGWLVNQI